MAEPLDFLEKNLEEEPQPVTTWKVILISALVAVVVGCLPALGTALVVSDNNRVEALRSDYRDCLSTNNARRLNNGRIEVQKRDAQTDVTILEASLVATRASDRGTPEGIRLLEDSIAAKKDVVEKSVPTPLLDCAQPKE